MESSEAATMFAALSQETRLELLRLLISEGPLGLPAGELSQRLGVPSSTLSFHLAALERAGLTSAIRQGRQIVHAARIARIQQLLGFLTDICCGNRPEVSEELTRLLPPVSEDDSRMTPAFNVLFLCTHNAARSIMAEALLRKAGGRRFHAYSAGSEPIAKPNPDVIKHLHSLGYDTAYLRSKSWHEFTGPTAPHLDFVITLCDTLQGRPYPDFGSRAVMGAWPLPDPAKFTGSQAERTTLCNEVYASLQRRIALFISLPFASLDRRTLQARLADIGGRKASVRGGH